MKERMKNEASKLFRKLGMTVNLEQPMREYVRFPAADV